MAIRKTLASALAAGIGLGALLAAAHAASPSARTEADALGFVVPDVWGKGIPLGFSGLDGTTSAANPCLAVTKEEPLTIQFQLPKDPVLRIYVPGESEGKVRYRAVTNDLIVAALPSDPATVVMAFVSSNVLVGRLPRGGRVNLTGGDMNCQLMRKDVAGRTQFAFAWDSKSGKAAAEAAAGAVNTAIDTMVENRLEFFKHVPAAPDDVTPLVARTLAKAFSVMKFSVNSPEGRFRTRWTAPARWPLKAMTLRESALSSLGLGYIDSALAKDALAAVYGCQGDDGFTPAEMDLGKQSDTTDVPVLGWAALRVYQRAKVRDPEFLQRSYDAGSKHVKWFVANRMVGEKSALFSWKAPSEAEAPLSLELSCYLAAECWTLQQMAQVLGFREDAKTWGDRAESIAAAARQQFWNQEKGFFFGRDKVGGDQAEAWLAEGLLPLWSGVATKEQAARLVQHLKDPKKFWAAVPVPLMALDSPVPKTEAWRFRMHVPLNHFIFAGLYRYGCAKEAEELRQKTIAAVAKWYGRTGCLYESYDAQDQFSPEEVEAAGSAAKGPGGPGVRDFDPTAALFADLVLRPKP